MSVGQSKDPCVMPGLKPPRHDGAVPRLESPLLSLLLHTQSACGRMRVPSCVRCGQRRPRAAGVTRRSWASPSPDIGELGLVMQPSRAASYDTEKPTVGGAQSAVRPAVRAGARSRTRALEEEEEEEPHRPLSARSRMRERSSELGFDPRKSLMPGL